MANISTLTVVQVDIDGGDVLEVTNAYDAQQIVDALTAAFSLNGAQSAQDAPTPQAEAPRLVTGPVDAGTQVRIVDSDNPSLVGAVLPATLDQLGDNVVTLRKPSGKRVGFNYDDLDAGKLAFA